ncbi:glycosyltransferase family 2 protein [Flavobacterium aquariorum]|uniref:Glycosyltransferase family 2 protein n=1 Tax=Flavobacterium aquariorum TaxID=2217670 RepID=A0A2W7TSV8_9FLAO|nr:glycosyltransferase family 2 protein [Flavobacterium aquariorum]PZX92466.1 glycosyltransferase family 2 protein [Flavobacterium aquariorum]
MNPILSIIIPCYNSEATLETTLESVLNQEFQDWEVIIVNDGSIDSTEKIALKWVNQDSRFKYFAKENEGLGKTRNYGIARSKGIFILPLDSDNQLMKDFVQDAIDVFKNKPEIGVIYGDAEYFGERNGLWKVDQYNFNKILAGNYIDACAIYRKKNWVEVGGYDENMPYQGHEDWEFWIALGVLNVEFYHLNKITFKYFVSNSSMIRSFTDEMLVVNQNYIVKKYSKLYFDYYSRAISKTNKVNFFVINKLKSEKFVIDLFCKTFFGFTIFKNKLDEFE